MSTGSGKGWVKCRVMGGGSNLDTLCFDCLHCSVNYPARFQPFYRQSIRCCTTLLCPTFLFPSSILLRGSPDVKSASSPQQSGKAAHHLHDLNNVKQTDGKGSRLYSPHRVPAKHGSSRRGLEYTPCLLLSRAAAGWRLL